MKTATKKLIIKRAAPTSPFSLLTERADPAPLYAIRQIGSAWALHWNAGDLDKVVAAYARRCRVSSPHHRAVHGREAIRGVPCGGRSAIA